MIEIDTKSRATKFIKTLPKKHRRQIKDYILKFQKQPVPHDSKHLTGYKPYMRADCGEYRIIYRFDNKKDLVTIVLIGKRNGDEVYKRFKQLVN